LSFQLITTAALIFLFLRSTRLDQIDTTARAMEERYKLANVTTQIAQRISRRTALADLLNSAVEEIHERYSDIYHVQIFLIDETTREAALAASTGEIGQRLLERGTPPVHRQAQSVIGSVTAVGEAVIARSGSPDGIHRRNELLPETEAEAAFPLKIGETVIGALDLQSRIRSAFDPDDMPIFQSLADSIALAIDNAGCSSKPSSPARKTERLKSSRCAAPYPRSGTPEPRTDAAGLVAVTWATRANSWASRSIYANNASGAARCGRRRCGERVQIEPSMSTNRAKKGHGERAAAVARPGDRGDGNSSLDRGDFTPEDVDLVQAVAERFGLAVESTRLYEESQRVAQRETTL